MKHILIVVLTLGAVSTGFLVLGQVTYDPDRVAHERDAAIRPRVEACLAAESCQGALLLDTNGFVYLVAPTETTFSRSTRSLMTLFGRPDGFGPYERIVFPDERAWPKLYAHYLDEVTPGGRRRVAES